MFGEGHCPGFETVTWVKYHSELPQSEEAVSNYQWEGLPPLFRKCLRESFSPESPLTTTTMMLSAAVGGDDWQTTAAQTPGTHSASPLSLPFSSQSAFPELQTPVPAVVWHVFLLTLLFFSLGTELFQPLDARIPLSLQHSFYSWTKTLTNFSSKIFDIWALFLSLLEFREEEEVDENGRPGELRVH